MKIPVKASPSWVVRNKVTKEVQFETFSKAIAGAINREKYEAVEILPYLASLNTPVYQPNQPNL